MIPCEAHLAAGFLSHCASRSTGSVHRRLRCSRRRSLAVIPLAGLMGDATEALGESLGPTLGGLLNATLGNAPEIIISIFALRRGLIGMVKSSLTGSIIGNLLVRAGPVDVRGRSDGHEAVV